ncbi:MAG: flagellar export protein FliJ [Armatimonadetes bacterium]|nr:flagellar export protein FliJ [Armatimonadota bacterium]MDW8152865.1 flagellar export protein FliJ [Armatimonadota bacterium]
MRRFRFRLEGLRRLRMIRERQARRELSDLLRALREAEVRLERARSEVREAEARVREAQDARALRVAAAVLERARLGAVTAEQRMVEWRTQVEAAWARFLQVRTERQVVERLRERRLLQHRREEERREQVQADEAALLRSMRRP